MWVCSLPDDNQVTSYRLRRSARVILFDPTGDVLLIRFVAERNGVPYAFWVTPGGEVEPGESDFAAASRELIEELGLRVPLLGPVHEERGGTYTHLGETVRNADVFFAAVCARSEPVLGGVTADEIALMREARWWLPTELVCTADPVFPAGLAAMAARVWGELLRSK